MSEPAEAPAPVRCESVRLRRTIAFAASVGVGASVVGAALTPYLLAHQPEILLALSPEPRNVVLTASLLPPWVIIPIAVVRRVLGLMALYAFGWAYGQSALIFIEKRFGKMGKLLRWVERGLSRHGAAIVLLLPMPSVCTMAGVAGTRAVWAIAAMTLGQIFYVSLTWAFGDLIAVFTTPIVEFLTTHAIEATVICVAVVGLWQLSSYLRGRGAPDQGT